MVAGDGATPQHAGRFDGYDVLAQLPSWDEVTAAVVARRLRPAPPMRFFTPAEQAVAGALFDQLLDQHGEPKVPVLAMVDQRLADNQTDGWRYAEMPEDGLAWRRTLGHLDDDAGALAGCGFAELPRDAQAAVVQGVQDALGGAWHGLPARHVWSLWTRYACTAFYAHPWAWNEIGFGGPAYPRGYKNLGTDARESWERPEHGGRDPLEWGARAERAKRAHAEKLRRQRGDR